MPFNTVSDSYVLEVLANAIRKEMTCKNQKGKHKIFFIYRCHGGWQKIIYKLIEQIRIQAGYWLQFLKNP